MDPVRPDYAGASVRRIVPAMVANTGASWLPETLTTADAVVLLVLDGLGTHSLDAHRSRLPAMSALDPMTITTVVPSTTSSALTSIVTGLTPSQHGITGFRMRVDQRVLNVLRWRFEDGHPPPDPFDIQRHEAFLGRPVPVVTKREFRGSGFSQAHLRGSRFTGWSATSTLVEHCRRLTAGGEQLVYAYYPGIDTVAHEFGLHDGYFERELVAADHLVGELVAALPGNVAVAVTADHGHVHVGSDGWIELDPLNELVAMCSGDGRFRYLHARRGAAAELLDAAREAFGHLAWIFTREELLEDGWLGAEVSPGARRRVGEVILAAREPVGFVDPALPGEAALLAAHGSITPDEMQVPLLSGRGTA
ncbi:MAG: alkaline phosphatase family protein [Acidimicrobiia bacterium]|nr:alkaline phosphatase family protein [Acidimicrobiia bacterium]